LGLPLCEFGPRGSVRGKVCIDVVDPVAGVCLTAEWITCEQVAAMAIAFARSQSVPIAEPAPPPPAARKRVKTLS
jgi:hypothetical protein